MAAAAQDPTLGMLLMFALGVAFVVVVLAFIAVQVLGEHSRNAASRDRHGHS